MRFTRQTTEALRDAFLQNRFFTVCSVRLKGGKFLGQLNRLIADFEAADLQYLNGILAVLEGLKVLKGKGRSDFPLSNSTREGSVEVDFRVDVLTWFFGVSKSDFLLCRCGLNSYVSDFAFSYYRRRAGRKLESVIRILTTFLQKVAGDFIRVPSVSTAVFPDNMIHRLAVLRATDSNVDVFHMSIDRLARLHRVMHTDSPVPLHQSHFLDLIKVVKALESLRKKGMVFDGFESKLDSVALKRSHLWFQTIRFLSGSCLLSNGVFEQLLDLNPTGEHLNAIKTLAEWIWYSACDLMRDQWLRHAVRAQYHALPDKPLKLKKDSEKAAYLLLQRIPADFLTNSTLLERVQVALVAYQKLFEEICPGKAFSLAAQTELHKQGVPDSLWLQGILEGAAAVDFENLAFVIASFRMQHWSAFRGAKYRWSTAVWHPFLNMPPVKGQQFLFDRQQEYGSSSEAWKAIPPFENPRAAREPSNLTFRGLLVPHHMTTESFETGSAREGGLKELVVSHLFPYAAGSLSHDYLYEVALVALGYPAHREFYPGSFHMRTNHPNFFEASGFQRWFLLKEYPAEALSWFFENALVERLERSATERGMAERVYGYWGSFWERVSTERVGETVAEIQGKGVNFWEADRLALTGPDPESALTLQFRLAAWRTLNHKAGPPLRAIRLPLAFFGSELAQASPKSGGVVSAGACASLP